MFVRRNFLVLILITGLVATSVTVTAFAQDAATTCSALVSNALSAVGTNCASLERGTTCFGYPEIPHTAFAEDVPDDFYTEPGDLAPLAITQTIQTGPFNLDEGVWGLNVMNLNANLPKDAAGKGVIFVQFGGVEVESAVDVDADEGDLTPMQSFYLRTGLGGVPCAEAPSLLFVQAPGRIPTDIYAYEQHIRIKSTIILRQTPDGSALELIVLSGIAILNPDSSAAIFVPPGYVVSIALGSELLDLGIEGDADDQGTVGSWSAPRPLTTDELEELAAIEDIPGNLLNYVVRIPQIVGGSSVGGVIPVLMFPISEALDQARAICSTTPELFPEGACEYLQLLIP